MQNAARKATVVSILVTSLSIAVCQSGAATSPMVQADSATMIAKDVYVIPDGRVPLVPNVGIIIGTEKVLVVDTGMGPANAEIVLAEVARITDKPIGYLVCTHFHPEHNFGAQSFPDDTVIIYATTQRQDLMKKGQQYRQLFIELFGDSVRHLLENVRITPPDVTFERQALVDLGDRVVELHHFGWSAHTNGDTVIYVPDAKIVFAGGLVPNRFFPIMPDTDSSGRGWIASLDALGALDIEIVVPGHGEVGDRRLITNVKIYLSEMQTRVRELTADGQSLDEIKKILRPEFEARYPNWDDSGWVENAAEIFHAESTTDD